jgi:hypothetical protein
MQDPSQARDVKALRFRLFMKMSLYWMLVSIKLIAHVVPNARLILSRLELSSTVNSTTVTLILMVNRGLKMRHLFLAWLNPIREKVLRIVVLFTGLKASVTDVRIRRISFAHLLINE